MFYVCFSITFLYRHLIASLSLAKFGEKIKSEGPVIWHRCIGFATVIQMFDKLLQHFQHRRLRQQQQQTLSGNQNKCHISNNNKQSVLQATYETHFRHSNYFNGQFIYLFWLQFRFFSPNLPFKECVPLLFVLLQQIVAFAWTSFPESPWILGWDFNVIEASLELFSCRLPGSGFWL